MDITKIKYAAYRQRFENEWQSSHFIVGHVEMDKIFTKTSNEI